MNRKLMLARRYFTAYLDLKPNVSNAAMIQQLICKGVIHESKTKRKSSKVLIEIYRALSKTHKIVLSKKKGYVKPSSEFYRSSQWRKLRYQVLKKFDGCCCLCGRSKREHNIVIHVDHIKPRSKYPELELEESNLQLLCEDCNLGKSNRDSIDWR